MSSWWWSVHTHSKYSRNDALPDVWRPDRPETIDLVTRAQQLEYTALGLTDHGTMGGVLSLYTGCRKVGIKPLPGVEAYVTFDITSKRPKSVHMCIVALSATGYRNLVGLNNAAMANHRYKPLVTVDHLAMAAEDGRLEGLAALSGCFFGMIPTLAMDDDGQELNVGAALQAWFDGRFFVEIQNHGIMRNPAGDKGIGDVALNRRLVTIADTLGAPVVITQDSHYTMPDHREAHDTYKRLFSWNQDDPDDALFPGQFPYSMIGTETVEERFPADQVAKAKEGMRYLESMAKVRIPELDDFHFRVPTVSFTDPPEDELVSKVRNLAKAKHGGDIPKRYADRLDEELGLVVDYGFNEYLLLVSMVCDWMREEGIFYNTRGSATGSVICWYLGITRADPIRYDLPFERFISPDRGKPPDIDLDVPDSDRQRVLDHLSRHWYMLHISNWVEGKMKADDEGKGSLVVKWKSGERKRGSTHPEPNGDVLQRLHALAEHRPYTHLSVHPAGVVLADDPADLADLPLQYVSGTLISAFDGNSIENTGLLKLDVLGLKTLRALKLTMDSSGVPMDDIPLTDRKVYSYLSQGNTAGVFQLQGGTNAKVTRLLKPRKLSDVIAAVALGRPAIMGSSLDDFLDRRHGKRKVPTMHPIIAEATKDTYGIMLYQEQVITVLKGLGFNKVELARALKAIKASNANVGGAARELEQLTNRVYTLCDQAGMSNNDKAWLADSFIRFSGYSFNKAHATSYGLLAYYSAWYAVHHPLDFWTGLLTAYTGDKTKELVFRHEARIKGIKMFRPDVNRSEAGYTVDRRLKGIRYGLLTIPGVGPKCVDELLDKRPFESVSDLVGRVDARKVTGAKGVREGHSVAASGGAMAALNEFGALEDLS